MSLPLKQDTKTLTVNAPENSIITVIQNEQAVSTLKADQTGIVSIGDLLPGEYELIVSKDGFLKSTKKITISDNNMQAEFILEPVKLVLSPPAQKPVIMQGTVKIKVYGDTSLQKYIQENGAEIRINNGAWKKINNFPAELKADAGKAIIAFRAAGIQQTLPEQKEIISGKDTEVFFVLEPMPSKITFKSNIADAEFLFQGVRYKSGSSVSVIPFREYDLQIFANNYPEQQKTVMVNVPSTEETVYAEFKEKEIPYQAEYSEGMSLLENKEYKEALTILSEAGQNGNPDAAYQVAVIYQKGLGMFFSNSDKAFEWYKKAAELGHAESAWITAEGIRNKKCKGTYQEMLDFYMQAATGHHATANYQLYLFYKTGTEFLDPDENNAIKYLQDAANLDHPDAEFELGRCYEYGKGIPFSTHNAIFWYDKAAKHGLKKAEKRAAILRNMKQ